MKEITMWEAHTGKAYRTKLEAIEEEFKEEIKEAWSWAPMSYELSSKDGVLAKVLLNNITVRTGIVKAIAKLEAALDELHSVDR